MNRYVAAFITGIATLAITSTASATVLIAKNLADLTLEAESIVAGTIERVWAEASDRGVDTFAELRVESRVKGARDESRVRIKTPGGSLGELDVEVPSAPRFSVGDEVFLFLGSDLSEPTNVIGWEQGTFSIENGMVVEAGMPLRAFVRRIQAILENGSH